MVRVDATAAVARVIFTASENLGFETDARTDTVYSFEEGITDIEIYNAADNGPLTF